MIERPTYLFFLFNELGAPMYVDAGGNIQFADPVTYLKPDGQLANLEDAPEGWQGILVKYARNIFYQGLFRDMTVPMFFHKNGAKILRHQQTTYGYEAVTHLGIMKLDRTVLPYNYDSWYLTEINHVKYKQENNGVTIEALEGGLSKLIKANENTKYKIPIDTDKSFHVIRDGVVLTETANFEISGECPYGPFGTNIFLNTYFVNKEGQTNGVAWFSQNIQENTEGIPITSLNFLGKAGGFLNPDPAQVKITGKIIYKVLNDGDGSTAFRMRFQTSAQDAGNQDDYNLGIPATFDTDDVITTDVNIAIPLATGDKLYLVGIYFGSGPFTNANIEFLPGTKLAFTYSNRAKTTYSKEVYGIDLLKSLVSVMSDGKYTAESVWLTSRKDISFTCGPSIRNNGRQMQDVIETSLRDLFQALGHWSVGLTVRGEKLILEPMSYFFKDELVIKLGVIGDKYDIIVAEDLLFNEIRAGYGKREYSNVNGKYETNQGQNWIPPVTKIVNKLDLESSYRADPIGTELYRIETQGLDTTDKSDDKDVFISNIETISQQVIQTVDFFSAGNYMTNPGEYPFNPGTIIKITGGANDGVMFQVVAQGVNIVQFTGTVVVDELAAPVTITFITGGLFKFYRPAFTSIVGIPDEMKLSIYNLLLTPKQAILNNGAMMHGALDLMDANEIKFGTADLNENLETILAGVTLKQKQNIQIGALAAQLWKPYYINFKTKVDVGLLQIIDDNPFGKVEFICDDDVVATAFLMDGGVEPATLEAQEWKLLIAPEVDMKRFKLFA